MKNETKSKKKKSYGRYLCGNKIKEAYNLQSTYSQYSKIQNEYKTTLNMKRVVCDVVKGVLEDDIKRVM